MVSACVDFVEKHVKNTILKNVKHVKMKKDSAYGEMCCSRQRFKMTAQKRHLSGRRHFSVVAFLLIKSVASMVLAQSYRQTSTKCAPTNRVMLQLQRPVFLSLPRVGPHCARHKLSMNIFWKNNGSAMKRSEKKNYSRGWKKIVFVIWKKTVPEKIKKLREGGKERGKERGSR